MLSEAKHLRYARRGWRQQQGLNRAAVQRIAGIALERLRILTLYFLFAPSDSGGG